MADPVCAYCRQHPALPDVLPFCSERCKMADLGQWLTGQYRLAGTPNDPLDFPDDDADHASEEPSL
jgi:hypothetical protein